MVRSLKVATNIDRPPRVSSVTVLTHEGPPISSAGRRQQKFDCNRCALKMWGLFSPHCACDRPRRKVLASSVSVPASTALAVLHPISANSHRVSSFESGSSHATATGAASVVSTGFNQEATECAPGARSAPQSPPRSRSTRLALTAPALGDDAFIVTSPPQQLSSSVSKLLHDSLLQFGSLLIQTQRGSILPSIRLRYRIRA
ncbi:hypothetical protein HPB50_000357 [Hyalomma asiaticum]|uniref:Uncharacterized protein n=1 Tax=Hyalomma asiaticum TaxID=266040 RepID=A0ACB7SGE0_HYAAI|nr:hypothetical protein HPB50_000357 [Hyalomma asiaticum]